jgi:hypothetical protein
MATAEGHGEAHDAHGQAASHGQMEIGGQRALFQGFLKVVEWSCVLLAMLLALLVGAFAIGLGWWAGLAAWVVIGLAAGFLLKMGSAWWATLIASSLVLGVGGALAFGISAFL